MTHLIPVHEERIRQTLTHLRDATTDEYDTVASVEPSEFTDAATATRERNMVFGRVPSIVCHVSEIPHHGDFMTVELPRNNVLVVRQFDGAVKAFVNVCGHRGELLENRERGRCRTFTCELHRWSYGVDGTPIHLATDDSLDESDPTQHRLVELPIEERHGLVWMVDDASARIDVASWLGAAVDEILAGYHLGTLVAARYGGFDEPVNWKVMQDAFIDNYHIQYAHPNTAGKHVHTNVQAVEDYGRHARMLTPRKTIDRWLEEDPGGRSLANDVIDGHFLLPNSTLLRQPDHFELLTFRPHRSDPGRSRMEMRLLVPTVADGGLDPERWRRRWDKNWEILMTVLHQEDIPLLRASQRALRSADGGSLVLGRNEVVNHIFRRELRKLVSHDDQVGGART